MTNDGGKKGKYQHRDAYLNATLDIIHEVGVENLTMRKVAEHLGVSAMAIYKHFPRKEDLLIAALDEFIARADVIPHNEMPWKDWINHMARRMYAALCSEPNWLPWLGRIHIGTNAMAVITAFLQRLTAEGLDFQAALLNYLRLVHILMGAAAVETALDRNRTDAFQDIYSLNQRSTDSDAMVMKSQLDISLPMLIEAIAAELAREKTA